MESLKRMLLDALFPPRCVGCGKGGALICQSCESAMPKQLPPFCSLCARPLTAQGAGRLIPSLCSRCARSPLAIDGIRSVFVFEGAARQGVLRLKYNGLRSLVGPFGEQMGRYVLANPFPVDAIVPVPLHVRRLRERGYNQSILLAREVSRLAGLKLLEKALVRVKDAPSQAGSSSAEERRKNVQGAFKANEGEVKGLCLLVIDDVCTTGSTLEACSIALRQAGAKAVWGLTLAREV